VWRVKEVDLALADLKSNASPDDGVNSTATLWSIQSCR
jgi:hypothetical protein